jgi:uncharacterized membrane-anchored protein YhcB (DUF1043 family)
MSPDSSPSSMSVHLPASLIALSLAIFLGAQIGAANQGTKTMKWQLTNLEKQGTQLDEAKKQLGEAIVKSDELVKQTAVVQQQYTALLNDVLDLSKNDKDAAKIVDKWKIQRNAPGPDAAGADAKPK